MRLLSKKLTESGCTGDAAGPHAQPARRLLHLLLSQDISSITVGEVRWASVLNRHGRMLLDLRIWCQSETNFVLICPPHHVALLVEHLSFHKVTEDINFKTITEQFVRMVLFGPRIAPILGLPDYKAPAEIHEISDVDVWSIPGADLQLPCRDLLIPSGEAHTVARELERRGSTFVGTKGQDQEEEQALVEVRVVAPHQLPPLIRRKVLLSH